MLVRSKPTEFRGEIIFDNLSSYQIETRQGQRPAHLGARHSVTMLDDQSPKLDLSGLERQTEGTIDTVLPVKLSAVDDYGLKTVGLFVRRVTADGATVNVPSDSDDQPSATREVSRDG